MTILGRSLHTPDSTQELIFLLLILAGVSLTMSLAAGYPTAVLGTVAAAVGYTIDKRMFLSLSVLAVGVVALIRGRDQTIRRTPRRVALDGVAIGAGFMLYELGRYAFVGDPDTARRNGQRVLSLERKLGLGFEPSLQRAAIDREQLLRIINGIYSWGFLSVALAALFWLYLTDDKIFQIYRNALGASAALAVITIALFPVEPPRLLPTSDLIDTHAFLGHSHGFVNEYAAVPSLHVGWMALVGFVLSRHWRGVMKWVIGLTPATIMTITVIVTGNHFWLDGLVGSIYTLVPAWLLYRRSGYDAASVKVTWHPLGAERVRAAVAILRQSPWMLFSLAGLGSLLIYLIGREAVDSGFTNYWGYMVFQIVVTLAVMLAFEIVFHKEGGLSWYTHLVVVVTTWFDTLGTAAHMYDRYSVYDKITHFAGGVAITAAAACLFRCLVARGYLNWSLSTRLIAAIAVSVSIGGIWEIYEYLGDILFSTGRHAGSLDTIYDLISDTTGSIVSAILMWRIEPEATRQTAPATSQSKHVTGD
jgi:hypothetical protein